MFACARLGNEGFAQVLGPLPRFLIVTWPACPCAQARWELLCSLCGQAYGACIQCAGSQACVTAFHPLCARAARLHMAAVPDFSADSDSDDAADQGAGPDPAPDHNLPGADATGDRGLGGCGGEADRAEGAGGALLRGAAGRRAKRRRHAPQQGGTALAGGRRLVCFCVRHAAADACARPVTCAGPGAAAGGANAAARGVGAGGPGAGSRAESAGALAASAELPSYLPCAAITLEGSSRTWPFNHALRRGARAPEALAAALAKRAFVQAKPYIVSTARHSATPPPSRCFRAVASVCGGSCELPCTTSGPIAKPDVCSAARLQLQEMPGPWVPGVAGANSPGSGRPASIALVQLFAGLQRAPGGRGASHQAAKGNPQAGTLGPAWPCAGERSVLSLAERMEAMRRTLAQRVTCGAHQPGVLSALLPVPLEASGLLS